MSKQTSLAVLLAAVAAVALWLSDGKDASDHARRSSDSCTAETVSRDLRTTASDADVVDANACAPEEDSGLVTGEVVVSTVEDSVARITVKNADGTVHEEVNRGGGFELEYERRPDSEYELEVNAPRTKPVKVPLPTSNENVGRIVLQSSLAYRVRISPPHDDLEVVLRSTHGHPLGVSKTDGRSGQVDIALAATGFSRTLAASGDYANLLLTFKHPERSFSSVPARPAGFGAGHNIVLRDAPRIIFRLVDRESSVPMRLEANRPTIGPAALLDVPGKLIDVGNSDSGGEWRPFWPETDRSAWAIVGPPGAQRLFLVSRMDALKGPIVLNDRATHPVRIRVLRGRDPVQGAEVIATVGWTGKHRSRGSGWLRGVTDGSGDLSWVLAGSEKTAAGPVEIKRVDLRYVADGIPHRVSKRFQKRGRGHRSTQRLLIRVGAELDDPKSVWFRCRDAAGGVLTPTAISVVARVGDETIAVGTSRPIRATGTLFEAMHLALPSVGRLAKAELAYVTVDTIERGARRFNVDSLVWGRAGSADQPLELTFPEAQLLDRRVRVSGPDGQPIPRVVVTAIPSGADSRFRRLEYVYATTGPRGTVQFGHLATGQTYRLFAFDPIGLRTAYLAEYEVGKATDITDLPMAPSVRFRSELQLDKRLYADPKWLTVKLVSVPESALPSIACTVKTVGGRAVIEAGRESGLAGYVLEITALHSERGRQRVAVPASKVVSASISFPG